MLPMVRRMSGLETPIEDSREVCCRRNESKLLDFQIFLSPLCIYKLCKNNIYTCAGNSNDVETLQDIYLCGNMNRNSSDAIGNGENNTVKERRFFVSASDTSKENAFERKGNKVMRNIILTFFFCVIDTVSPRYI